MTGAPIGATAAWLAAAEAAGEQCEHRGKGARCGHVLRLYHLYLAEDGHLYCEDHKPPPAAPVQAAPEGYQDALF